MSYQLSVIFAFHYVASVYIVFFFVCVGEGWNALKPIAVNKVKKEQMLQNIIFVSH